MELTPISVEGAAGFTETLPLRSALQKYFGRAAFPALGHGRADGDGGEDHASHGEIDVDLGTVRDHVPRIRIALRHGHLQGRVEGVRVHGNNVVVGVVR